ncbi:MAG: 4Fe-4S dicluster domain-containing protein [Chloroflexi bacterium]|nr:4Fe-4S dicluster domain-containing protein [Chloroflexota bacterium]
MNEERISRRHFLKTAGGVTLVVVTGGLLLKSRAEGQTGNGYSADEHYWGFAIDTSKCIGCGKCVLACKQENHVPMEPESYRTWVDRYVITENGEVLKDSPDAGIAGFPPLSENPSYQGLQIKETFFVPKLCNQCENPPCVSVCPVKATYTTKDGVILVDEKRCIGCKYCIVACPYGVRYLHPETKVADKCTFCYHRVVKGLQPACVQVCPTQARIFGDLRDPESPVTKLLVESVQVLKPEYGTKPKVYYVRLPEGVN